MFHVEHLSGRIISAPTDLEEIQKRAHTWVRSYGVAIKIGA